MNHDLNWLVTFGICLCLAADLRAGDLPPSLYLINSLAQTLSKITLENRQVSNNILTIGEVANRIHTRENTVYIVNSTPPGITAIDARDDTVIRSVALPEGSNPWDMEFAGGDTAYITGLLADAVYVYDLASGDSIDTIAVGVAPEGILRVGDDIYVTNSGGWFNGYMPSTISRIDVDSRKVTGHLEVPLNPQDLDLAPDGKLHVICTGNYVDRFGKVAIIDIAEGAFSPVDTVVVGGFPGDIAITNAGICYVSDFGDASNGWLYAYDATTLDIMHDSNDPILVGAGAIGIFYDSLGDALYIPNLSDDTVQSLDPASGVILDTYEVGDGPSDVAAIGNDKPSSVTVKSVSLPEVYHLAQNYPNPFNPLTNIEFHLQKRAFVSISVFNLHGQAIRTLVHGSYTAGTHLTSWDGYDDRGQSVASGKYVYTMAVVNTKLSRMLTLIK